MGSNSGGSLARPIFVLGLGIIFGAVISFLTKRKRDQLQNKTDVSQSEIVQDKSTNETEEPVGCCGGGSCGTNQSEIVQNKSTNETEEPVGCCGGGSCGIETSQPTQSESACGTGGCGTGSCSTGNEISKVQKIHFLIGSKTGAASKFANDVHNYIQAFNTTIKCVKTDIDTGRFSKLPVKCH